MRLIRHQPSHGSCTQTAHITNMTTGLLQGATWRSMGRVTSTRYTYPVTALLHRGIQRASMRKNARRLKEVSERTWAEAKADFAADWERECEFWRVRIATEAYARDILTEDGITTPLLGVVKLTGLTANAAALGNIPFTPLFSADVLAYAATTTLPGLTITAVLPEGATVEWVHGTNAAIATASASFSMTTGENVVTCTVSKPQHTPTTYTLTITRS